VAAAKQPPALKGFFTIEMCTDYFRHIVMFGGAPQVDFLALWLGANFTDTQVKLHVRPLVRALMSHVFNSPPLRHFWQPQVQKRMTRIMKNFQHKTPSKEIRELFATWVLDGKTRQTNSILGGPSGSLDRIRVPFVVVQNPGHFNLHQFGAYDLFENAGRPRTRIWMIIGPAQQPHGSLPQRPKPRACTVSDAGAQYFSRNTLHYGAETYVELSRVPTQAE
jgi:predicted acyl esterase